MAAIHGAVKAWRPSPHIHHFAEEGFAPFIIYIVRDGRDVALSFRKAMVGEKHSIISPGNGNWTSSSLWTIWPHCQKRNISP
jgi:hypothetical protein